jgi:hypothetical protein
VDFEQVLRRPIDTAPLVGMWPWSTNICFWAPDRINFRLLNSPSCGANIRGDFGQAVLAAETEFISRAGCDPTPANLWRPKRNRSHQFTLEVTQNRVVLASIATGGKGVLIGAPSALEPEKEQLL